MDTPGSLTKGDLGLLEHLIARYGALNLIAITRAYVSNDASNSSRARVVHGVNAATSPNCPRMDGVLSRASMISNASSATGSLFSDVSSDPGAGYGNDSPRASCARGGGGVPFLPVAAGRPPAHHHAHHTTTTTTTHLPPPPVTPTSDARSLPTVTMQPASKDAAYQCPFCSEYGIVVSIARKSDFKRHLGKFHNGNNYWKCSIRGCFMSFEWKSAYETHLREAHRGVHREEVIVETCPQVVWACGVRTCKEIYEATSDADAEEKATEYFNHVAKHFRPGDTQLDWSYSVRFRNLMRQSPVEEAWKSRGQKPGKKSQPEWKLQNSFVLRKQLETRHIADADLFVKWATTLCTLSFTKVDAARPHLPAGFAITPRNECPLTPIGHDPSGAAAATPAAQPNGGGGGGGLPSQTDHAATHHKSVPLYSPPDTPNRVGTPGLVQMPVAPPTSVMAPHHHHQQQQQQQQWPLVKAEEMPSPAYHHDGLATATSPMYNPQQQQQQQQQHPQHAAHIYGGNGGPMVMDEDESSPHHPLLYYPAFTGIQEELPTQQAVIDDVDRHYKSKLPLSNPDLFNNMHLPSEYTNVRGVMVVGDPMNHTPDIDMADYGQMAAFYPS